MKILIKVSVNPKKNYLVSVLNEELLENIYQLVSRGENRKAIDMALSKGSFIEEISDDIVLKVDAGFILTENSVHYDLM